LFAQYERFKLDAEKRLIDKEEELNVQRVSNRRQIETLQESIETAESRAKSEISSLKKKYQAEIEDLKSRNELTKRALADAEANSKKIQQSLKEVSDKLYEEQHTHDADRELLIAAEKRASSLRGEIEEIKTLLERVRARDYKI